jgi:hypothetical protein
MIGEEPALTFDAVKGRVPFDRFVYAGDGSRDERIEAAPDIALPAGHGHDIGLDGRLAIPLCDLGIAA